LVDKLYIFGVPGVRYCSVGVWYDLCVQV